MKHWRDNNKDKVRMKNIKRREWRKRVVHNYTIEEWNQKVNISGGLCIGCNTYVTKEKLQLDHIIPLSKAVEGFVYTINDVQPLCGPCNSSKGCKV